MRKLIATLLFIFWPGLVLSPAQRSVFFSQNVRPAGGTCTAPTSVETSQWPAYGAGVTCVSACGSGVAITLIPDTVGSLNLTGSTGTFAEPSFSPSSFGSLTSALYSATPNGMLIGSGIPTSVTSTSFWVTIQTNLPASPFQGIISGSSGSFEWYIDGSAGNQHVVDSNTSNIGVGSAVLANNTKYTLAVTFNATTGAWALYTMAGGVVTTDGSGTVSPVTFTSPITEMGVGHGTNDPFAGEILDAGYFAGIWNATALNTIAAYSSCKFGI